MGKHCFWRSCASGDCLDIHLFDFTVLEYSSVKLPIFPSPDPPHSLKAVAKQARSPARKLKLGNAGLFVSPAPAAAQGCPRNAFQSKDGQSNREAAELFNPRRVSTRSWDSPGWTVWVYIVSVCYGCWIASQLFTTQELYTNSLVGYYILLLVVMQSHSQARVHWERDAMAKTTLVNMLLMLIALVIRCRKWPGDVPFEPCKTMEDTAEEHFSQVKEGCRGNPSPKDGVLGTQRKHLRHMLAVDKDENSGLPEKTRFVERLSETEWAKLSEKALITACAFWAMLSVGVTADDVRKELTHWYHEFGKHLLFDQLARKWDRAAKASDYSAAGAEPEEEAPMLPAAVVAAMEEEGLDADEIVAGIGAGGKESDDELSSEDEPEVIVTDWDDDKFIIEEPVQPGAEGELLAAEHETLVQTEIAQLETLANESVGCQRPPKAPKLDVSRNQASTAADIQDGGPGQRTECNTVHPKRPKKNPPGTVADHFKTIIANFSKNSNEIEVLETLARMHDPMVEFSAKVSIGMEYLSKAQICGSAAISNAHNLLEYGLAQAMGAYGLDELRQSRFAVWAIGQRDAVEQVRAKAGGHKIVQEAEHYYPATQWENGQRVYQFLACRESALNSWKLAVVMDVFRGRVKRTDAKQTRRQKVGGKIMIDPIKAEHAAVVHVCLLSDKGHDKYSANCFSEILVVRPDSPESLVLFQLSPTFLRYEETTMELAVTLSPGASAAITEGVQSFVPHGSIEDSKGKKASSATSSGDAFFTERHYSTKKKGVENMQKVMEILRSKYKDIHGTDIVTKSGKVGIKGSPDWDQLKAKVCGFFCSEFKKAQNQKYTKAFGTFVAEQFADAADGVKNPHSYKKWLWKVTNFSTPVMKADAGFEPE
eukprot:TRINITY_DN57199_c0_g1_i1.p1 TRINITY_DN57199_c0_g1~~TRINITY_DN57199_c0_g1_i1.p1  ORF type:complete len:915 (-),score=172.22 TRINITY_DN57199_c0_g1_i1:21-2657(-)